MGKKSGAGSTEQTEKKDKDEKMMAPSGSTDDKSGSGSAEEGDQKKDENKSEKPAGQSG